MYLKISNEQIRLLWLSSTGLVSKPEKSFDLLQIIKDLGFVQLDTIQNVTRAHHHILWSRNSAYKEHMLDELLEKKGSIFEHFTHDASIIPLSFYPMWQTQFLRQKTKLQKSKYYKDILNEDVINEIKNKIIKEGALSTKSFETKIVGEKKMWARPPHKNILDYLWYIGELSTSHRKNFRKYYDISEKVIPYEIRTKKINNEEQIAYLCFQALERLGVASLKEIKNFWDVATIQEVKIWYEKNKDKVKEVQWVDAQEKCNKSYALDDIEKRLKNLKNIDEKIKIVNPFDPAIRDRIRLKNIFDFDYKIEIFVPKEKRKWGYYVYPLLQGTKFIGRIELKANRKGGYLEVVNFWREPCVLWTEKKQEELEVKLLGFANFVGIFKVNFEQKYR